MLPNYNHHQCTCIRTSTHYRKRKEEEEEEEEEEEDGSEENIINLQQSITLKRIIKQHT